MHADILTDKKDFAELRFYYCGQFLSRHPGIIWFISLLWCTHSWYNFHNCLLHQMKSLRAPGRVYLYCWDPAFRGLTSQASAVQADLVFVPVTLHADPLKDCWKHRSTSVARSERRNLHWTFFWAYYFQCHLSSSQYLYLEPETWIIVPARLVVA